MFRAIFNVFTGEKIEKFKLTNMLYLIPTKRGLGIEIWGNYDDLNSLYNVISKFWSDENNLNHIGYENRSKLISGFSYEIRKAKDGRRDKRTTSHFSFEPAAYFGTKISWVHFLFSLAAIRYNMRFYETTRLDIAMMLQLEFWLENAMKNFDEIGAKELTALIDDGLYGANPFIYQYMRSINLDYFLLGGGKKAFRKLPELLERGCYSNKAYEDYFIFLRDESMRLKCNISELELNDNHINYEDLKW